MSEATPISELMEKDPLSLSDKDLDAIIGELRKQRHRFVLVGDKKIGTPAAKKSKAQTAKEKAQQLLASDKGLQDLLDGL